MNITESKNILKSGLIWGNLSTEQKLAFERAVTSIERYEKIIKETEKVYRNECDLEELGSQITNIIINDINTKS